MVVFLPSTINSQYTAISGGVLKQVTTSPNYVWGINIHNNIYKCNRPCHGSWTHVGGHLMQVDAGQEEVWGVNRHHQIFKIPVDGSGHWRHIGGHLTHVSASGNGYIWGVNRHHQIFKCKKPCVGHWHHVGGHLMQIDGGNTHVYGVNRHGHMYRMPVDGNGHWRHVPGGRFKYVTDSGASDIFAISFSNKVYRCEKPCVGAWEEMTGNLKQCDATFDSFVGVSPSNQIYRRMTGKY